MLRSCIAAAEAFQGDTVGARDSLDGTRVPAFRLAPLVVDRTTTGALEAMPFWAGEEVGAVKRILSAAEIIDELTKEAESLLRVVSALPRAAAHRDPRCACSRLAGCTALPEFIRTLPSDFLH